VPGEIPRYDEAFWRSLLKRGYFAGRKIRIDIRATGQHLERGPELTAELVRLDVDVIFAVPGVLAKAAQLAVRGANKTTPIVFGPEPDPVGFGFVASLAHPGGNMTGLAFINPEFDAKRLQILKEAFPRISRVAYLTNPTAYPGYFLKATSVMETAARTIGIQLKTFRVNTPQELKQTFTKITRMRAEAMVVSSSPPFTNESRQIVDYVAKRRLPAIYGDTIFVEDGGLMFYGTPFADWKRHAAEIVAKILKGANPGDIPVEQPTTFKLIINLKAAKALGLTIPLPLIGRADEVIE
jgi:putative ABC transport system substrate-binding protein